MIIVEEYRGNGNLVRRAFPSLEKAEAYARQSQYPCEIWVVREASDLGVLHSEHGGIQ